MTQNNPPDNPHNSSDEINDSDELKKIIQAAEESGDREVRETIKLVVEKVIHEHFKKANMPIPDALNKFFSKSIAEFTKETKDQVKAKYLYYDDDDYSVFPLPSFIKFNGDMVDEKLDLADQADKTGQISLALSLWEDVILHCEDCLHDDEISKKAPCYYYIGLVYYNKANLSRSIDFCLKALKELECKKISNSILHYRIYDLLGAIYQDEGNIEQSIYFFYKALSIKKKRSDKDLSPLVKSYNNLGAAFYKNGKITDSIEFYSEALKIIDNNKLDFKKYLKSKIYNNLGLAYCEKMDFNKTIELCSQVNTIMDEAYHPETSRSDFYLGSAYYNLKNYETAENYYLKSLEKHKKVFGNNHPETANVILQLGLLYLDIEATDKGLEYLNKSFTIIKETSAYQDIINISNIICSNYLNKKYYNKSLPIILTAVEVIEKNRKTDVSGGILFITRNIISFYYTLTVFKEIEDLRTFFNISERMRSMGYSERLSIKSAAHACGISNDIIMQFQNLRDNIEHLSTIRQKIISLPIFEMTDEERNYHEKRLSNLSSQLAQAESDFIALDNSLMSNEKYRQLRNPDIATIEQAKELCGTDGIILEYIIPPQKGEYLNPYILIISAEDTEVIELDKEYLYSDKIDDFRKEITKCNPSDITTCYDYSELTVKKLSIDLYNTLINPVQQYIKNKNHLIIVPDGPLAFLPFDALRDADGNYLNKKLITFTPSISVSVMIRDRNYTIDKKFLAFGGGIYSDKDDKKGETKGRYRNHLLPQEDNKRIAERCFNKPSEYFSECGFKWNNISGTGDEVIQIGKEIFNNSGVDIYTGHDVTEKKLKQLSAEGRLLDYKSIHFSCHGYFNPEYPLYSALVFSEVSGLINDSEEDGYLTVEDASVLNIKAEIVVLSACNTGMGKFVSGDGITGLTRGFQVAGANSVLVTLWEVDDEATKKFMVSMYSKVQKDKCSYREAVKRTKDEFITKKSDPYYWAGFVLYE